MKMELFNTLKKNKPMQLYYDFHFWLYNWKSRKRKKKFKGMYFRNRVVFPSSQKTIDFEKVLSMYPFADIEAMLMHKTNPRALYDGYGNYKAK